MQSIFKSICKKETNKFVKCAKLAKDQTKTRCLFNLREVMKCSEAKITEVLVAARNLDDL